MIRWLRRVLRTLLGDPPAAEPGTADRLDAAHERLKNEIPPRED